MVRGRGKRGDLPSPTVGKVAETFLVTRLSTHDIRFEVYTPVVDAGSDYLAFSPNGELLRIQSKGRSERMAHLWDVTVGQRTVVGPPTHFFFMHGSPHRRGLLACPCSTGASGMEEDPEGDHAGPHEQT